MTTFYEKFSYNIHSTHGENGLIEEILARLKISQPYICEFGNYRNTLFLSENKSPAIYISEEFEKELTEAAVKNRNIALVKVSPDTPVEKVLKITNYEKNFDILGLYGKFTDDVWKSVKLYCPKIVIIESGNKLSVVNSLIDTSILKGYQFVQHTGNSMIFVREELFPVLNIGYGRYEDNFIGCY